MKNFGLTVGVLFFVTAVECQNKNFDWGNNLSLENNLEKLIYADSLGNAYFKTQNKEGDCFIEMQKLHDNKSAFATKICQGKSDFEPLSTYNVNDGIIFIGKEYDKKTEQLHFKENTISWEGNLKTPELQEFLVINVDKKNGLGSVHICVSADRSKIIITYREPESEVMQLYGFDEKFNKLFEKKTFLYKNSKHGLLAATDFLVSNNGDFIFQQEKIKITKKNGDWESVEDWIFVVPFESTATDSTLLMGDLSTLGFLLDNTELIIFGTTHVKGKGPGTYFCRYDIVQKKFLTQVSSELTAEMFVTPGALDNSKGKPSLPRSSIEIKRISKGYYVIMDAGSYSRNAAPNGMSSLMINMVNCDILFISPEGKTNWIATIFRDHVGTVTSGQLGIIAGGVGVSTSVNLRSDDFSLYDMRGKLVGDELLFFMNDDAKNVPQPASNKDIVPVRKAKQFSACTVRVSADGKITKEPISGINGELIRWHPSYSYVSAGYMYAFFDGNEKAGGVLIK